MPKARIFISHRHGRDYADDYYKLVKRLDEHGYNYSDYSVPKHDRLDVEAKRKITVALREQVRQCNFFIIFVTRAVGNSEWCMKELKAAKEFEKYRLGIKPWNYQGGVPPEIRQYIPDGEIISFNIATVIQRIQLREILGDW